MLEFVKVKKDNQVKSVDKGLLRDYLTAGWVRVDSDKNANSTATSYTPYASTTKPV